MKEIASVDRNKLSKPSINDSTLLSVCYTVIYMVRVGLGLVYGNVLSLTACLSKRVIMDLATTYFQPLWGLWKVLQFTFGFDQGASVPINFDLVSQATPFAVRGGVFRVSLVCASLIPRLASFQDEILSFWQGPSVSNNKVRFCTQHCSLRVSMKLSKFNRSICI